MTKKERLPSIRELAQPLDQFLKAHYPRLTEETRIAFGVQIVLAHEHGTRPSKDLHHLGGLHSPN